MILDQDLVAVDAALAPLWPRLSGAHIFMTGGTGFIGRWMLEALARSGVDAEATILSRDPAGFTERAPHLAARFRLVAGDVLRFDPPAGDFTHVIHAATDASAALNARDPRRMFDTIVAGTRRALDLAVERAVPRFLFLSSGAVYGAQPWEMTHVAEDWHGGPDVRDPRSAYGEGKRAAEMLCAIYGRQFGLDVVNARIFALLGPLLSLDVHFAAGNFIRDAMAHRTIRV
jgi:dTDP-glucose 4,6-dehydratase